VSIFWNSLQAGIVEPIKGDTMRTRPAFRASHVAAGALCLAVIFPPKIAAGQTLANAGAYGTAYGPAAYDTTEYDSIGQIVEKPRQLGLMFDVGTLDGAMMSLVYRPMPWIRFQGGAGTNSASPGFRLGAVAVPYQRWPTVSLEGGHFFEGDINGIVRAVSGYSGSRLLERFDYNFVNLQLGWEVERGDLLLFARVGLGFMWTQLPAEDVAEAGSAATHVDPDGSVRLFMPTLKVGIIGFM
jgi:hypothetical protein